jgi:hypothetical protein
VVSGPFALASAALLTIVVEGPINLFGGWVTIFGSSPFTRSTSRRRSRRSTRVAISILVIVSVLKLGTGGIIGKMVFGLALATFLWSPISEGSISSRTFIRVVVVVVVVAVVVSIIIVSVGAGSIEALIQPSEQGLDLGHVGLFWIGCRASPLLGADKTLVLGPGFLKEHSIVQVIR